jgi:tyrosyl-tRNA synthetase
VFHFPPACARVYAPHVSHFPSPRSTYASYEAFEAAYTSGAIGADDLKASLGASINAMLEPVRQHFQNDARAKAILEEVRSFKVTR